MTPLPPIIGLYSSAPACGKSEVAKALTLKGWKTLKFATPLKDMLIMLLMHGGYSLPDARRCVDGDLKELPLPGAFNMKTPRYLMQSLGTEWGRTLIANGLWTTLLEETALRVRSEGLCVVVDDVRFPNEYDAMRAMGATLIWVKRPGVVARHNHPSEGQLDGYLFDREINNDSTVEALFSKTYSILPGTQSPL